MPNKPDARDGLQPRVIRSVRQQKNNTMKGEDQYESIY